ncbi:MAG: right-handed parallel beta-helix repeat-containing protein [Lentisphaeria bacterium]|nr:right-handed parallel beta-helix repeat-containing protein [Lentisphaeria bacterium]
MHTFHLADFPANDVEGAFRTCFAAARKVNAPVKIVIAPGEYPLAPLEPIELFSGLTVEAEGAKFIWPRRWQGLVHRDMFKGADICDFSWNGGCFEGHVFDVPPAVPVWKPECCARGIVIETSAGGRTEHLHFRNIEGEDCSGSVVSVYGYLSPDKQTRACDIDVRNCRFKRCGKFMWDYGYLWEKLVFADFFTPAEVALGERYASPENRSGEVRFHGDCISVDAMPAFRKEERHPFDTIAFYGRELPPEIRRGKCYFLLGESGGKVYFSDIPGGKPFKTSVALHGGMYLFRNLFSVFHWGYAPENQGPGKGSLDLVCCSRVNVCDCELGANGDAMHIHTASDVVFCRNLISSARMGAFFLAFNCSHADIYDNTVHGTNGSRVLTVERGCHDVNIHNNVFTGGGRGCWFNQNDNITVSGNVFRNNVQKGIPKIGIGRRSPFSGAFERYPEIYFTHALKSYGNIIMRGNVIESTPDNTQPAILFEKNGSGIILEDNVLQGTSREIAVEGNADVRYARNDGVAEYNKKSVAEPL